MMTTKKKHLLAALLGLTVCLSTFPIALAAGESDGNGYGDEYSVYDDGNYNGYEDGNEAYEKPPLSVQLNGDKVSFSDVAPEIVARRTMVPFRAIIEALGGTAAYSAGEVSGTVGGTTVTFTIGQLLLKTTAGDVSKSLMIDSAPYIKKGRTYVPVRFFAQALGLNVEWDEWDNCAVLYDGAALVKQIDDKCTVLNTCLAAQLPQYGEGESLRQTTSLTTKYKLFNTLDGDKSYSINGTLQVLGNGVASQASASMDFRALVHLTLGVDGDEQLLAEEMLPYADDLKNATFEMIYDSGKDTTYLRCPLLLKMNNVEDDKAEKWLKYDGGPEVLGLTQMQTDILNQKGRTIGEMALNAIKDTYSATDIWEKMQMISDVVETAVGDAAMNHSGSTYTTKVNIDDAHDQAYVLYEMYGLERIKGTIILQPEAGAISVDLTARSAESEGETETKLSWNMKKGSGTISGSRHIKNTSLTEFSGKVHAEKTNDQPQTVPPGDEILSAGGPYTIG